MNRLFTLAFVISIVILPSCKDAGKEDDDSIFNSYNYTVFPTTYSFDYDGDPFIYYRERFNSDVILSAKVFIGNSLENYEKSNVFVVPRIYTYSGDCKIHPKAGDDRFIDVDFLGEVFTYTVINDPSIYRSFLFTNNSTPESEKYGPYCRINMTSLQYGRIEDVLITPMAHAFIHNHDYNDNRKIVFITFAQREIYGTSTWQDERPLIRKAAVHGIIALADHNTAFVMEERPQRLIHDTRLFINGFSAYD